MSLFRFTQEEQSRKAKSALGGARRSTTGLTTDGSFLVVKIQMIDISRLPVVGESRSLSVRSTTTEAPIRRSIYLHLRLARPHPLLRLLTKLRRRCSQPLQTIQGFPAELFERSYQVP